MAGLEQFAKRRLAESEGRALFRSLSEIPAAARNFCSNDYLGLSCDPRLVAAACDGARLHGAGAGASRLVTGNHALYQELETRIAALKGTESALVFGSGYLANVGAIPALVSDGDLVIADELSHSCMWTGARLSGARVEMFRHNDIAHLGELLASFRGGARHCLILTEGVFSMDGDRAPLQDIAMLAKRFDAWLMTDDAHGLGVVGQGRGSAHLAGVAPDIQMGTLSKAVGSYGGYVAASAAVVSLLVNRARSLIFSTGLPPAAVAASIAGIQIIASDPSFCERPLANASLFCETLQLAPPQSAIVPLIVGESGEALRAAQLLETEGYLVRAIRPPTVPAGTARLRVTFTAANKHEDILGLAHAVRAHVFPLMGRR